MDLSHLPSPFYRVSVKAIILNDQNKLLVGKYDDGNWEVPGGGWEHDETIQECIKRELNEELGAQTSHIGEYLFLYKGRNLKGYMVVYLAYKVGLKNYDFQLGDVAKTKFVTEDELMELKFDDDEDLIKEHSNQIWP